MIYLICCTNFRMVYISIVCKTSRPTDCLRPQSHRSRRLQPAVIRLFLLARAPETYCASRTFTSAESAAHLSLDNRISLSHDFFQFWCSQSEGLFIPAARQIYEWSFALRAWYVGQPIRCSSLKCMSIKQDRVNCLLFGFLRRGIRKSSWSKFVESASCRAIARLKI